MMLKEERLQIILREIKKSSKVLSSELALLLNVSDDTIRRDLKELSDLGLIRKVHGGAILNESNYIPMNYDDRKDIASEEKVLIAQKAISLLKDEMLVFIDGGTTNLEIVKNIPENLHIKIMTNCLPIAVELMNKKNVSTYFLGGEILSGVPVTVGSDAISFLDEIRADIFFVGTRSISIESGISDIDRAEVLVKRKMAEKAGKVVSTATSDKLDSVQNFSVINIESLDTLITELNPDNGRLDEYKKVAGLELI